MKETIARLFGRRSAGSFGGASAAGESPDAALPRNRMLERIIAGRTVQGVRQDGAAASLTFTDGSVMQIKAGAPMPASGLAGKTVKATRQGGLQLVLEFEDGSQALITLAEETSSVLLRDGKGNFEYAD